MIRVAMVVAALIFVGCSAEHTSYKADVIEIQGTAEFKAVGEKVFVPNCVRCHSHYSREDSVLIELENILQAVAAGRMPKGGPPLSEKLKEDLNRWAGSVTPPVPEELKPNWESISKNIFNPRCVVCHREGGQARFLPLNNRRLLPSLGKYFDFSQPEESSLIQVVLDDQEPMPPIESNIRRLNSEEVAILTEWIRLRLP